MGFSVSTLRHRSASGVCRTFRTRRRNRLTPGGDDVGRYNAVVRSQYCRAEPSDPLAPLTLAMYIGGPDS